jgi:putative SOS response-associated peptidase YedK
MCGRFTLTKSLAEIEEHFAVEHTSIEGVNRVRYNIAPGQNILTVIHDGKKNRLGPLRWGLVPSWARDKKIGSKLINARAETIQEKASFKSAFTKRRCLIISDGFYEWKKENGSKQPYRIHLQHERLFAFAGLWEKWRSPQGENLFTCTIITTEPNSVMKQIHNRMPVILRREAEQSWINPATRNPGFLQQLLKPYPAEQMDMYAVSTGVNNPRYDEPELIQPIR